MSRVLTNIRCDPWRCCSKGSTHWQRIDLLKLEDVDELARRPQSVVVSASWQILWLLTSPCERRFESFWFLTKVQNKWNYAAQLQQCSVCNIVKPRQSIGGPKFSQNRISGRKAYAGTRGLSLAQIVGWDGNCQEIHARLNMLIYSPHMTKEYWGQNLLHSEPETLHIDNWTACDRIYTKKKGQFPDFAAAWLQICFKFQ